FSGMGEVVRENVPLARFTWYRTGGPARWFIQPKSVEDLQETARRCTESNIRMYVLGLGANILISDAGVNAAVFRLDSELFRKVEIKKNQMEVGAGADMQKLVVRSIRQGMSGIECLAGIPGTIGGGIRMNAGGKFGDIGSIVHSVQ